MAGRKTKLTPEPQKKIVNIIKKGNYIRVACQAVGISHTTYFSWIKKGEEGISPYVEFLYAVEKAESEAQIEFIKIIAAQAPKQWQAAAWWLERRFPEMWGRRDKLDIKDIL